LKKTCARRPIEAKYFLQHKVLKSHQSHKRYILQRNGLGWKQYACRRTCSYFEFTEVLKLRPDA